MHIDNALRVFITGNNSLACLQRRGTSYGRAYLEEEEEEGLEGRPRGPFVSPASSGFPSPVSPVADIAEGRERYFLAKKVVEKEEEEEKKEEEKQMEEEMQ